MTAPTGFVAAGAGRMGRSMAIAFAWAGMPIALLDLKVRSHADFARLRSGAMAEIDAHLGSLVRIGRLDQAMATTLAARIAIHPWGAAREVLGPAHLVLEGVPEVLADKQAAFALIEEHAHADCIVASTTSTFLSTALASMFRRPARFLNAHWLNPAYLIPLVEVAPHAGTDPQTTDALCGLLRGLGKVPVVCKDSPGFIVPRLQALIMNEAVRLVEEGVADAQAIDLATRLGFGMRYAAMGVLEFVDFGGLDILHHASGYLSRTVDEARYATPALVAQRMAEGNTGVRAGRGIHDWQTRDADTQRDESLARLAALLDQQGLLRPPAA